MKTTAQKLVSILKNNGIKVCSIWVENDHNQKSGKLGVSMAIKFEGKKKGVIA